MSKAFETNQGEKQRCRDLLCFSADQEIGHDKVKKIFTLPSREALCYQTFKSHFKLPNIVCIEREKDICEELWNKNIDCINSTIQDYANDKIRLEQHHDILFFDYYSFLSQSILKDLKAFLNNRNIVHPNKKSILGITLQKSMRQGHLDGLELLRDNLYKGYAREVENDLDTVALALKNYLSCEFDCSIRLLEKVEYQASEGSTVMYFFIFSLVF